MKKLEVYRDNLSAELAAQALRENQINAIVTGSKEYTSHVLGGDSGTYVLIVDEDQVQSAQSILNSIKSHHAEENEILKVDSKVYFRKAIMFSLMATFMIPILFNYVALNNLNLYLKSEKKSSKKYLNTFAVILLQIPVIYYGYLICRSFNF